MTVLKKPHAGETGYDDSGFLPAEPLPDDYIYWDEAYQHIGEVTAVYNDKGYNEETLGPYEGRTVMVYGVIQDWYNGIPMIDISLPESRLTCLAEDY